MWDPGTYLEFADHRGRPFFDLLARVGAESGHTVVISTGDKDLAQLVTPQVTLINTMAKPPERLDVAGVTEKFGVPPDRIIDYLTLIGDTVDNVPGVPKVGPKTAVKWIQEHGSLDGVIAAAEQIKGVAGENLRATLGWLPTGRRLITVKTDCDLAAQVPAWPALDALALRAPDQDGLVDFYTRYGFRSSLRALGQPVPAAAPASNVAAGEDPAGEVASRPAPMLARDYQTLTTWEQLDEWIARLKAAAEVTDLKSLQAFAADQVELAKSLGQKLMDDAKAYADLGAGVKAEFDKLAEEAAAELPKSVQPFSKAA